jgi:hypothetical protein
MKAVNLIRQAKEVEVINATMITRTKTKKQMHEAIRKVKNKFNEKF